MRATAPASMLALVLALAPGAAAAADVKKECAAAAESAQRLRKDGKLREAREQLVTCSRAACPGVVKSDCEPWLDEVDGTIPTVVVSAKDRSGKDLKEVKVSVDGTVVADRLDGKPIMVNPGTHAFRYEHGSDAPVEASVVLKEGDRGHALQVTFGPEESKPPVESDEEAPPIKTTVEGGSIVPGLVVGGIGLAAVGTFIYFYASARSDIAELERTCAPRCAQTSVQAADTKAVVSYAALGVGVVALGVATYLIVAQSSSRPARPAAVMLGFGPAPGGGVAGLQGRF